MIRPLYIANGRRSFLIIVVSRIVPGGIVGAIVPGRIVEADRWISWTGRHAPRFRIVQREMDGLGLLDLGCVDYATIRAQRCRWSAVIMTITKLSARFDSFTKLNPTELNLVINGREFKATM